MSMSALTELELLDLLKSRREHCRTLLEMSRRQMALIETDDYAGLLEVLGRKQQVLSDMDAQKRRHPGLQERWRDYRATAEPEIRDECEHVLAETEAILAELMAEEHGSTEFLTQRREATRRQLQTISGGTQVHAAYRDHLAPSTHRHLDLDQ